MVIYVLCPKLPQPLTTVLVKLDEDDTCAADGKGTGNQRWKDIEGTIDCQITST